MDEALRNPNPCEGMHKPCEGMSSIPGLSDPVEGLSEIALTRREQILDAAEAIITGHGIQRLSLGQIEDRAGMSRGQLTYYFPTKEAILLAVFDRLLQYMYRRLGQPAVPGEKPACEAGGWEWVRHLFTALLTQPPLSPDFHCLQYTFLSQIGY